MLTNSKIKDEFDVKPITSDQMERWVQMCVDAYQGNPPWLDEDEGIDTVSFAKAVCSETARLAMLATGIHAEGSARADWMQEQIDRIYNQLRAWVEYGCAYGTVILKPNGAGIDLYKPGEFEITHHKDGKIDGAVFTDSVEVGDKWYTKLEYHRFLDSGLYAIDNHCFVGSSRNSTDERIDIKLTPWADMEEEVTISYPHTLFAVLRTPGANNIDLDSPAGLPIFSEAIQELRDLDIAYSRNSTEINASKRIVLLDSDMLFPAGTKVNNTVSGMEMRRQAMKLPDYVRNVMGDGQNRIYEEINPTLNTETRIAGINALLNQIGYKCGFSNGHFVFNEKTGIQTATQVEADQQRTIQFIKDVRDRLQSCITDLCNALSAFADLYALAPAGAYELKFDFGDITYSYEEDKANWKHYATLGWIPKWLYLVKFEGMTEEDAKSLVKEAEPKTPALFGGGE